MNAILLGSSKSWASLAGAFDSLSAKALRSGTVCKHDVCCSGSMAFEENGERIQDLKVILQRAAEVRTVIV